MILTKIINKKFSKIKEIVQNQVLVNHGFPIDSS